MKEQFLYTEIYRPKKVEDCILPKRLKEPFQEYVNKKTIPNFLLSGPPGVGKTTIAKAMCEEIKLSHLTINSSDERGIDVLRTKIKTYASTMSLSGTRKVIILDEADHITNDAQAALRGTIEEFSSNCSFVFTCNFKSKIIEAIHSRCVHVDFTLKTNEHIEMMVQLFKRIKMILDEQKITYDPKVLPEIIKLYFPDYRRILNQVQHLAQSGNIDAGSLSKLNENGNIDELFGYISKKDYGNMRKWISENSNIDSANLYKKIYSLLDKYLDNASVAQAIVILSKYQYQAAFVADQEINNLAALTEIMMECEFNA